MKTPGEADPKGAVNPLRGLTPEQLSRLRRKLGLSQLSGNELFGEALRQCGVTTICGITGTPSHGMFKAAAARGIRVIGTRHQNTATIMAASANFLKGCLEHVVLVSAGPAVTNTMTGILLAHQNHWPLLVMGGRRPRYEEGAGYFQELDAVPMMLPITKWAHTVRAPEEIMPSIAEACRIATTGLPGPVYLDFPEDVLSEKATPIVVQASKVSIPVHFGHEEITTSLRLLSQAQRPLLCLGEDLRWSVDFQAMRTVVDSLQLPFITTSLARGFLPDSHPLCANLYRHQAHHQADLVLMAGAWYDWRFRMGAELSPDARVIHVHPDESTVGRHVALSLGAVGDPGGFLNLLADASRAPIRMSHSAWLHQITSTTRARRLERDAWLASNGGVSDLRPFYCTFRNQVPPGTFIAVEGSDSLSYAQRALDIDAPLSWLDPTWNGNIGGGIAMAMASKLIDPERPAFALVGDTGFGMSAVDLDTSRRHDLPIIVAIANNGGISGNKRQKLIFGDTGAEHAFLFSNQLDYSQFASGLGLNARAINDEEDIAPALRDALAVSKTSCLDIKLDESMPSAGTW